MKVLALALGGTAALYIVSQFIPHDPPRQVAPPVTYSDEVRAGCEREFPDDVTRCMTLVMVRDAETRKREALDRIP